MRNIFKSENVTTGYQFTQKGTFLKSHGNGSFKGKTNKETAYLINESD
ncbi:MAG: hypothetical protein WBB27_03310 [Maribacter sp.]